MRACTASATEISYNHSDDPEQLYRAEIEFISVDEWSKELKTLLADLRDASGNLCRDTSDPDSAAGLAYTRIKAVYPTKTKDQIARSDAYALTQEPLVRPFLGTIKQLRATNSPDLYEQLEHFVDSTEKNKVQMEYWRKSLFLYQQILKACHTFTPCHSLVLSFLYTLHPPPQNHY